MTHHATQTLQDLGYRLTPQRTLVWDVLRASGGHMSAEEVCEQVQRAVPARQHLHRLPHAGAPRRVSTWSRRPIWVRPGGSSRWKRRCRIITSCARRCGGVAHVHDEDLGRPASGPRRRPGLRRQAADHLRPLRRAAAPTLGLGRPAGAHPRRVRRSPHRRRHRRGGSRAPRHGAVRKTGKDLGERTVPLLGVTAAFIFAAQMLNFPIGAGHERALSWGPCWPRLCSGPGRPPSP